MELKTLREEISRIDAEIIRYLSERSRLAKEIAQVKRETGLPIEDAFREQELLKDHVTNGTVQGLDEQFVTAIFTLVIAESKRIQSLAD